ncbi:iron chelate uptake ABC transporter family permease subunit [Moraxella bovis]|uniref:iron chelate uptake ABC transporter family permease subunit n=1 Tax=Moraxella bovis TaxID=476 RepID=UPI0022267497|nr:iron chelate uptake ABC transporter family permease subunit [Moraxella bovis]UYZ68463.1 iron chelate uptake ABC transporter family permease subunit [Moraxella bovis]UYZ70834.1 iron chelate uptake ABC transporter family permease subunit [Moraxella bovis]UYZ73239.1 iron chelate uptake ABC transporter family permease subunit [Moraxella bovis]UYZ89448.1 iron chelate uptake ABC transporter family permease subunit [Moraxella bovis]UZA14143.1 iron chelate uptake ABC transporter family permease sub
MNFIKKLLSSPILLAFIVLVIGCGLYLTLNVISWDFALPLRIRKLIAFLVVGYAVGVSTLLFQTLTHNPILTPSLLGFDALYVLIQSLMLFFLGMLSYVTLPTVGKFAFEVAVMMMLSVILFRFLFTKHNQDLTRLILVGVIFGTLFRSLSYMVARMINPDEFVTVQAQSYASFTAVNVNLLITSVVLSVATFIYVWRQRFALDVLLLGRNCAISLGVPYHKLSLGILMTISLLVSMATALVGPITFFGLLVCALTNRFCTKMAHGERLILVTLIASSTLIVGQAVFEHVFKMAGVLEVVIELFGGVAFLLLIFMQYSKQRTMQ